MLRFGSRKVDHGSRYEQIHRLGLFATLDPRELRVVAGLLHERRYVRDEVVFDEGEEGQAVYIVFAGRVLLCRQGEPVSGRISEVGVGGIFGELALLDASPRSAQARAAEDCVLAAFFRSDFDALVHTHGAIASKMAMQLARELGQKLREHFVAMDRRPL